MEASRVRSLVEIGGGFLLIVSGAIGLVVPVMPGWVLIISGFAVLSRHFRWARKWWILARRARIYLFRRFRRRKLSVNPSSTPP